MTSKSDISTNKPSVGQLIQVATGETVLADTENQNNLLSLNAVILAYNWIIDSGADLTLANVFSVAQTFSAGLKTNNIAPLVAGQNTIYDGTGDSDLYKNNTNVDSKYQTGSDVNARIAAAGNLNLPLTLAAIQTNNFNAANGFLYPINATSNTVTGTLPASPSNGDIVGFLDFKGTSEINTITIARNGQEIMDLAEDLVLDVLYNPIYLTYVSSEGSWYLL